MFKKPDNSEKQLLWFHIRSFFGTAAIFAVIAMVIYNTVIDDLRLAPLLDNNYEGILIPHENDISEPVVNINTASVHHLQRINGIGEVRAVAIVEYREAHGGFDSVDELINVSGIGEKTLEAIRGRLTVN